MSHDGGIGDRPIEPRYRQQMNELARALDKAFNGNAKGGARTVGFCLLVFPFGDEGRCNYISNADRLDMVTLFREQLARLEARVAEETGGPGDERRPI